MKYSIIVPIYKVEECLDRCIESIVPILQRDAEAILVDDGSPDRSGEIAEAWAKKYSNITVIHKTNGGLSDSRNQGIKAAKGEYLVFLDSDDLIDINAFEQMDKYIADNPQADIYYGSVLRVTNNTQEHLMTKRNLKQDVCYTGTEALKEELSSGKYMAMSPCGVYKREFLINHNLYFKKGILHEDEQWSPRVELAAQRIYCAGFPFYRYIIREGSITQTKDKSKNAHDLIESCMELEQIYSQLEDKVLKKRLQCYNAKLYMNACSVEIRLKRRKSVNRKLICGRWITMKDFIRFICFDVWPYGYAQYIDKRFVR